MIFGGLWDQWLTIPVEVTHSWPWILEQEGLNGEGNRSVEQWRGGVIKVITNRKELPKKSYGD